MIFYTISGTDGHFCGFHRRWHNWFQRKPEFRWDTLPHQGDALVFMQREDAVAYAAKHLTGHHVKVAQNDTGGRDLNLRPTRV